MAKNGRLNAPLRFFFTTNSPLSTRKLSIAYCRSLKPKASTMVRSSTNLDCTLERVMPAHRSP